MNRDIAFVHERKKPFKCDICEYSCSEKKNMNVQVASVHEVKKSFKCAICDYRCSGKRNLNKHVLSVHEGKNRSNVLFVTRAVLLYTNDATCCKNA